MLVCSKQAAIQWLSIMLASRLDASVLLCKLRLICS